MAKRAGAETLAVSVQEQLRVEILNGGFAPGERLRPIDLGERFGVSLGVMREALGLLAARGLVRIDHNRGCHVMALSLQDLSDLTDARKINEGAALRLSVVRGGLTWESEVIAAHHRMANQPIALPDNPTVRSEEWARAHMDFHYALISACGNPTLLGICARLSDAAAVYRAWSGPGSREVGRDIAGEHKVLLDAALTHNPDLTGALFEQHLDRTASLITDFEPAAAANNAQSDR